jgi:uncharacterized membrane protein YdfJ with MMPL/SSD domain
VSFRSLVIPLTAVVLNMLSVAAVYGVLVAVFQWGWGQSLLNFRSVHAVSSWLPLFQATGDRRQGLDADCSSRTSTVLAGALA